VTSCGADKYWTIVQLSGSFLTPRIGECERVSVMFIRKAMLIISVGLLASLTGIPSVAALTQKECSAKYQAAKTDGTLGGKTWNDYRKTECAANAPAAATEPATKPATTTAPTKESAPPKSATTTAATPSNAVFPTAVSPKYSKESAGKARMHTCLDQYHANKANNANGGLKWIVKGGGYYSECNKRLKG
jgi:hypothetical protein